MLPFQTAQAEVWLQYDDYRLTHKLLVPKTRLAVLGVMRQAEL